MRHVYLNLNLIVKFFQWFEEPMPKLLLQISYWTSTLMQSPSTIFYTPPSLIKNLSYQPFSRFSWKYHCSKYVYSISSSFVYYYFSTILLDTYISLTGHVHWDILDGFLLWCLVLHAFVKCLYFKICLYHMLLSWECRPKYSKEFQSVSIAAGFHSYPGDGTTQEIKPWIYLCIPVFLELPLGSRCSR